MNQNVYRILKFQNLDCITKHKILDHLTSTLCKKNGPLFEILLEIPWKSHLDWIIITLNSFALSQSKATLRSQEPKILSAYSGRSHTRRILALFFPPSIREPSADRWAFQSRRSQRDVFASDEKKKNKSRIGSFAFGKAKRRARVVAEEVAKAHIGWKKEKCRARVRVVLFYADREIYPWAFAVAASYNALLCSTVQTCLGIHAALRTESYKGSDATMPPTKADFVASIC